jgi:hypothetical protein
VLNAIREWRASILTAALPTGKRRNDVGLTLVRGASGEPPAQEPRR